MLTKDQRYYRKNRERRLAESTAYHKTDAGRKSQRKSMAKYDASLKGFLRRIRQDAYARQTTADQLPDTITILGGQNGSTI